MGYLGYIYKLHHLGYLQGAHPPCRDKPMSLTNVFCLLKHQFQNTADCFLRTCQSFSERPTSVKAFLAACRAVMCPTHALTVVTSKAGSLSTRSGKVCILWYTGNAGNFTMSAQSRSVFLSGLLSGFMFNSISVRVESFQQSIAPCTVGSCGRYLIVNVFCHVSNLLIIELTTFC